MMGVQFPQKEPSNTRAQPTNGKTWVTLGPNHKIQIDSGDITTGLFQTKLLFNEAIPARTYNRATHVCLPAPIVIEKLIPQFEEQENVSSNRSSLSFSALSEERLLAAVKLAKRDLRRRHHESLKSSLVKTSQEKSPQDASYVDFLQKKETVEIKCKTSSPKEKATRTGANLVHTPQKLSSNLSPEDGLSPLTRDSGPGQLARSRLPQLNKEIRKLQNELGVFIQKIEKLANMGHMSEDPLEPDEQHKMDVRRQKQAARSAQIIYVLQQQVKEIQEDLERLRSQKNSDTRKSKAIDRLAAAHRGAVRAMQIFIHQLSEPRNDKVPSHYKEMGQLIRQLSLCSAKIEVDQGSALPETALDILQKLETLDLALSKQERLWQRQVQARSSSPQRKSPHRSMSPPFAPRGPTTSSFRGPRKAAGLKRSVCGRRVASQKPRGAQNQHVERRQVLRAGLESMVQQRELREETRTGSRPNIIHRKERALNPQRSKTRDVGFQQPTVSSQLRVNQLPQKDRSVPWIPTSPHSPPLQRTSPQRRPEPRCLFSPLKPSPSPQRHKVVIAGQGTEEVLGTDKRKQAQNEALRQAWLDKMTMQRLKELNQMSQEETERIQRLRSDMESPTQWAERAEQNARKRIQPLLDEVQNMGESRSRKSSSLRHRLSEQTAERAAESAEQLSEALLEDLLDDAARAVWAAETDRRLEGMAQCRLQAPTLESMLLRMEEMQRDQEEVRRRITTITYSDPLYWDRVHTRGQQCHAADSRPASPQPVKLTRPLLRHSPAADIVLERPVETGHSVLSESSLTEEASQDEQQPGSGALFPGPTVRSGGSLISVPSSTLRSIQQYREEYDAYLRLVAHEPVGGFNPWAIADSLADELMSEALADVAAEFQNVCEEYAEAVFTSEFLQPIQSPSAAVPPLGSQ
ncbi:protein moonraker [Lampris incognitus]|uniref:protein moonraker n=1 Tax=Lampris incognitus TaxID=2546036 RepID=UPI0024B4A0AF|nr:protein moonraker [Lampris incognitus]